MSEAGPNRWQALAQNVAFSRPGAWLFSRTLHHVDRFLLRLTGGRLSVPRLLGGVPVVLLTTTGAKSGKARTVPVLGLRDGDHWLLVASNWGRDHHPAWYYNLRANPEVTLTHVDVSTRYVAEEATDDDREEYWQKAMQTYPGFERWQDRTGEREIPMVVLHPIEA